VSQTGHPRGFFGHLAGMIMAQVNEPMMDAAIELLDVQPDEQILEIGFGPGVLIQRIARRLQSGFVAGVDVSDVMVRQATGRNKRFIGNGRVQLREGSVSNLPFPDGFFTAACAINSFQFWPTPDTDLLEVRRVLKYRGRLLLGLRIRNPNRRFMKKSGFTPRGVLDVKAQVERAGFRDVTVETRRLAKEHASFICAHC